MSAITLQLRPETERKLRDRAAQAGQSIESLLQELAEKSAGDEFEQEYLPTGEPKYITRPRLTFEEFKQNLKEMASGPVGKSLPPDFSRGDIYDDED